MTFDDLIRTRAYSASRKNEFLEPGQWLAFNPQTPVMWETGSSEAEAVGKMWESYAPILISFIQNQMRFEQRLSDIIFSRYELPDHTVAVWLVWDQTQKVIAHNEQIAIGKLWLNNSSEIIGHIQKYS